MVLRAFGVALLATFAVATGYALAPHGKACDLKKVEKGWWCEKDAKVLAASEVDADKKVHKGTEHAVTSVEVCVKSETQCKDCPMHWASDAKTPGCCEKHKTAASESMARVGYMCEGCGAWALTKDGVKHQAGEAADKQKVAKACEKSGHAPHGGS